MWTKRELHVSVTMGTKRDLNVRAVWGRRMHKWTMGTKREPTVLLRRIAETGKNHPFVEHNCTEMCYGDKVRTKLMWTVWTKGQQQMLNNMALMEHITYANVL